MSLKISSIEDENNENGAEQKPKEKILELTPEMEAAIQKEVEARLASQGVSSSKSDIDRLADILAQTVLDNKKDDDTKFNSNRTQDKEDILDSPVIFYCPKEYYVIGGDKKNGKQVPPPQGPIIFKYMHTIKKQTGKDIYIQQWCKLECWSKAELVFLKEHSTFGSMFYEKADPLIQTEDNRMMVALMRKMSSLKNVESYRILAMMKENGLPIGTDDVEAQKLMLATHMAKKKIAMVDGEFKTRVQDSEKERALLGLK